MRKRLLVIDDDYGVRDAFQVLFEAAGFDVQTEIDYFNQFDGLTQLPDVILLDRQLGLNDGLDICRQLKANDATTIIPVVMMSATFNLEQYAMAAGADAYLEKPVNINELVRVVNHWATYRD